MSRSNLRRVLVAVVTALVLLPASALAAQPVERFHAFTDTFSDELCGIPVDVVAVGVDNFFLYADDSFKDTASVRATVTNPANGKSVIISNAGQVTEPRWSTRRRERSPSSRPSRACRKRSRRHRGPSCSATPAWPCSPMCSTWRPVTSSPRTSPSRAHPDLESDFALFCG